MVEAVDPKRTRILMAAAEILQTKGYAAMTTLEVAQAAGISKRDLYARFANKDALVAALVLEGVQEMLAPVRLEPPVSREAFYAGLTAFGCKFLADMLSPARLQFYRLAIGEVQTNPAIGQALLKEGTEATTMAIGAYFGEAQARRIVKFPNVHAAVGVYFYMLMGDRMVTHLLDPERRVSEADIEGYVTFALMVLRAIDDTGSPTTPAALV
ncbi:MAG: TetR/AcrR family transcriptional regulator [Hyphomicrobiaceae bacterium]|nr:TetR/AcrR family transcriptional regulator [Hyphomicrobiaceae bacterium]